MNKAEIARQLAKRIVAQEKGMVQEKTDQKVLENLLKQLTEKVNLIALNQQVKKSELDTSISQHLQKLEKAQKQTQVVMKLIFFLVLVPMVALLTGLALLVLVWK